MAGLQFPYLIRNFTKVWVLVKKMYYWGNFTPKNVTFVTKKSEFDCSFQSEIIQRFEV